MGTIKAVPDASPMPEALHILAGLVTIFERLSVSGFRGGAVLKSSATMWDDRVMTGWDTAQICLNGHLRTRSLKWRPELGEEYCGDCGAKTITECQHCRVPIRGYDWSSSVMSTDYAVAHYCHNCGKPYPWTVLRMDAAAELLHESELSPSDQTQLIAVLPDLVIDTPKTQVAIARYQRIMKSAGKAIQSGMRDILVDVASEAVKKAIWG